jgi:DNA-binding NarL/FixJ family response regulator
LCLGSLHDGYFEQGRFTAVRVAARALAGELNDWCGKREAEVCAVRWALTQQDRHIVEDIARGLSSKQIARARGVNESTVNSRLQKLTARIGVPSRFAAARTLYIHGLIDIPC